MGIVLSSGGQYIDNYGCPVVFKKAHTYIHTNLYQEDKTMDGKIVVTEYAYQPEELERMLVKSFNDGKRYAREQRSKARKRKIDAVKNFLGLAAILVLPPLGMITHWLVVGY